MKKSFTIKFFFAAFLALLMLAPSKNTQASGSWSEVDISDGKDYWFAIAHCKRSGTENIRWGQYAINLWVSSKFNTSVTISSIDGSLPTQNHQVQKDLVKIISIPDHLECKEAGKVLNTGIHLVGQDPVSVAVFTAYKWSGEAYRCTPVEWLGKKYYTINLYQDYVKMADGITEYKPGQIIIVATQDDTQVTYKPACETSDDIPKGGLGSVTLDKGQCYLIESKIIPFLNHQVQTDLTGSYIEATKPVACISGHTKGAFPRYPGIFLGSLKADFMRNMLTEMIWPVELLGNEYVSAPIQYLNRNNYDQIEDDKGDLIRLIATEDNTILYEMRENGQSFKQLSQPLMAGEWYEITEQLRPSYYKANHPIVGAQYGKAWWSYPVEVDKDGDSPLNPSRNGQGMLLTLAPVNHWCQTATFYSPADMDNFVYLTFFTDDYKDIYFDGDKLYNRFGSSGAKEIKGSPYSYLVTSIGPGSHNLQADEGARFAAYAYGNWDYSKDGFAYGYPVGINFAVPCEDSLTIEDEQECGDVIGEVNSVPDTVDCAGIFAVMFMSSDVDGNAFEYADNYEFELNKETEIDFTSGDTEVQYYLTVKDMYKPANGQVKVITTSGKAWTSPVYTYTPEDVVANPPSTDFGLLKVGDIGKESFTISNPTDEAVTVYDLYLKEDKTEFFTIKMQESDFPFTLEPKEEKVIEVEATSSTVQKFDVIDSVVAKLSCYEKTIEELIFRMGEPIIYCTNINYGVVKIGDNIPREFTITNKGNADLEIYGYNYNDGDSKFFDKDGNWKIPALDVYNKTNPLVIKPNENYEVTIYYKPDVENPEDIDTCHFETNANHIEKDWSEWKGIPVTAGPAISGYDWKKKRIVDEWTPATVQANGYEAEIEIWAIGSSTIDVKDIFIEGDPDGVFTFADGKDRPTGYPLQLNPNEDPAKIKVYFWPKEEKEYYSDLANIVLVADFNGDERRATASLAGTGIVPHATITGFTFPEIDMDQANPYEMGDAKGGHEQPGSIDLMFSQELEVYNITFENGDGYNDADAFSFQDANWLANQMTGGKITLQTNQTIDIPVRFDPKHLGPSRAYIVMYSNAYGQEDTIKALLEGTAIQYGLIPTDKDFGIHFVTTTTYNGYVDLKNTGGDVKITGSIRSSLVADVPDHLNSFDLQQNLVILDENMQPYGGAQYTVDDVDFILPKDHTLRTSLDFTPRDEIKYTVRIEYNTELSGTLSPISEIVGEGMREYTLAQIPEYPAVLPGTIVDVAFNFSTDKDELKKLEEAKIKKFKAIVRYNQIDIGTVDERIVHDVLPDVETIADIITEGTMTEGWTVTMLGEPKLTELLLEFENTTPLKSNGSGVLFKFPMKTYLSELDEIPLRCEFSAQDESVNWLVNRNIDGKIQVERICVNDLSPIKYSGSRYSLKQNVPNPIQGETTVEFSVAIEAPTVITLYNNNMQVVDVLVDRIMKPGSYKININVNDLGLASGVYYYTMKSGPFEESKTFMIAK